jgi:hypothetical protein
MVDMADEGKADTFEHTISGRVMTLNKNAPGKVAMLERYWESMSKKANAADTAEEGIRIAKAMSDAVWGLVETQFIDPADLEFVQLEIVMGRVDESVLGPILANGMTRDKVDDDADPAPVKKTPGRKTSPKKAAPRANPSRAKR